MIRAAAAVASVALSSAAVALFPRSILLFLVFQTSLLLRDRWLSMSQSRAGEGNMALYPSRNW